MSFTNHFSLTSVENVMRLRKSVKENSSPVSWMHAAGRKNKRIRTRHADRNYSRMGQSVGTASNLSSPSRELQDSVMMDTLPLAVLEEVLLNLPPEEVVCVSRLVCQQWKELADSASLWKERCRRDGFRPRDITRTPTDWRLFYFLCKKRRNLLKNPRAQERFRGWKIVENGGDQWKIEKVSTRLPDKTVKKFFVTSYGRCSKLQLIDLEMEGYSSSFMDELQPDILISDWYAPRWDCGCEYEICVELLNQEQQVIETFCPKAVVFQQWNDQQWHEMTHMFRDYGPGVRFIRFCHGGQDTQYWAGWYGIRVTNSSVEIVPSAPASPDCLADPAPLEQRSTDSPAQKGCTGFTS